MEKAFDEKSEINEFKAEINMLQTNLSNISTTIDLIKQPISSTEHSIKPCQNLQKTSLKRTLKKKTARKDKSRRILFMKKECAIIADHDINWSAIIPIIGF